MKVGDLVQINEMSKYSWIELHDYDKECGIILSVIGVSPGRKNASYKVYWSNSNSCRWHAEPRIRRVK